MNEIEIIRSQLAVEQCHAAEVANACATVFGSPNAIASAEATTLFREASVSYLVWVLARFEERDQTLSELPAARPLASLLTRSGTGREALARLESALAAGASDGAAADWREFGRFFNSSWVPRRAALEGALAEHLRVEDLRTVCAIDADSVLDERRRYASVVAEVPAGIELRRASGAHP